MDVHVSRATASCLVSLSTSDLSRKGLRLVSSLAATIRATSAFTTSVTHQQLSVGHFSRISWWFAQQQTSLEVFVETRHELETLLSLSEAAPGKRLFLRSLRLALGEQLYDSDVRVLAARFQCTLQSLDFATCKNITDKTVSHLAAALPHLKHLTLRACRHITSACLEHLPALLQLESLCLDHCKQVTDVGLRHLRGHAALASLSLAGILVICDPLANEGLAHLQTLKNLRHLNLSASRGVTDGAIQHLAHIETLNSLNLELCMLITDDALRPLQLASLTSLDVAHCENLTGAGLVCRGDGELQMQRLRLAGCERLLADNVLAQFECRGAPHLEYLSVASCSLLTDAGLVCLKSFPRLCELDLSCCYLITADGIRSFCSLRCLRVLNLSDCCEVDDAALQHVACLEALETLSLSNCGAVGDSGLQHLAPLSRLKSLSLERCVLVTDAGVAVAQHLTKLRALSIAFCHLVTGDGVVRALSSSLLLSHLNLYRCVRVSLDHIRQLQGILIHLAGLLVPR